MKPPSPLKPAPEERAVPLHRDNRGGLWVASCELLDHSGRLAIVHQGESYLLRLTRQNKLILNK